MTVTTSPTMNGNHSYLKLFQIAQQNFQLWQKEESLKMIKRQKSKVFKQLTIDVCKKQTHRLHRQHLLVDFPRVFVDWQQPHFF
jgi:hypothetical protein